MVEPKEQRVFKALQELKGYKESQVLELRAHKAYKVLMAEELLSNNYQKQFKG